MERISLSFLKRGAAEKASKRWRAKRKRAFNLPRPYSKPMIRIALRNAPKAIANRFCKLLSGHALISPLLKER